MEVLLSLPRSGQAGGFPALPVVAWEQEDENSPDSLTLSSLSPGLSSLSQLSQMTDWPTRRVAELS